MLYSFILEILIFLGIGAIIFILARSIPRIEDENTVHCPRENAMLCFLKKIPLDRIDETFNLFLHKILRKTKIIIMKADNFVSEKIKIIHKNVNSKKDTDKKSFLDF